jgi:hypothetical protein
MSRRRKGELEEGNKMEEKRIGRRRKDGQKEEKIFRSRRNEK